MRPRPGSSSSAIITKDSDNLLMSAEETMQAPPGHATGHNSRETMESPFDDSAQADYSSAGGSESESEEEDEIELKKKSRRPPENSFSQQRLKAVNPVFSFKTVTPILMLIGIIFIPLGGAMWLASHRVEDMMIDYSQCEVEASRDHWSPIPAKYTTYHFKNTKYADVTTAQWKLDVDETQAYDDEKNVCRIQFHVPHKIKGPLYFFYRLEKFHQNHRRYVKSFSEDQIKGTAASVSQIKDTVGLNCEPLSLDENGKKYYPCGLIANSLFNDTFTNTLQAVNGSSSDYQMTTKGIAWKSNGNRYKKTKYDYRDISPPRNWIKKFPNGYNATNVPDILKWEEFQNWMFTSGLPNFNKMVMRNDNQAIEEGIYEVSIGLHFPVLPYKGKKLIFLSQRSAIGGKNYFLGYAWIVCGGICIILSLVLLTARLVKPRKTGDENWLSWKKEEIALRE